MPEDTLDSTDASPVNSDLLIVNADTIWNIVPTIMPEDTLDSKDDQVASGLLVINADTIWNTRTVKMENQPPIANAGADQTVPDNLPVTLNGSNSTDEAPIPFYRWTENSYILSTEKSFTRMFSIGTHRVVLTVIDENGTIDMDDVIIKVYDATGPNITIFQPLEGQVFTTNTITVYGTASDPSGVQSVTVNGVYSGTTTWSRTITLTSGTNIITIVATDNAGNQGTATITVIYSHVPITNISVSSGVSYNQKTKILDISAYAIDNVYGTVTSGVGYYNIANSSGNYITSGSLMYSSGAWKASVDMTPFNLDVGVYVVDISITSNNRTGISTSQFNIVQGTSNITGIVLNGTEPIANAILELHDAKEYIANPKTSIPIKSTTTLADGSYEFNEVSAGSYLITANASRYINTSTFSFEITGTGETYTKNIIMVPSQIVNTLAYLNPDMESLHSDTLGLMDYETDQIAEISNRVPDDLGDSQGAWDIVSFAGDVVSGSVASLTKDVIENEVEREAFESALKPALEVTVKRKVKRFLADDAINGLYTIILDISVPHSAYEFKNTDVHTNATQYLDSQHNTFVSDSQSIILNSDFSPDRAKEVLASQKSQIELVENGDIILLILPDPMDDPMDLTLKNAKTKYMTDAAFLGILGASGKVLSIVQVTAGTVAIGSSATGIGAAAGATSATIAVGAGKVKDVVSTVDLGIKVMGSVDYVGTADAWVNDISAIPDIYGETSDFIKNEAKNPYYLDKDNTFNADVDININPDLDLFGKKIIYISPFTPLATKNADITVTNTGNVQSALRVTGQGFWNYNLPNLDIPFIGDIFGGVDIIAMPTSAGYFSKDLYPNQKTTDSIIYSGYYIDPANMLNPHVLTINAFSGPFMVQSQQEFYYPVVSLSTTTKSNKTMEMEIAQSIKLKASTSEGDVTLFNFTDLTPNIIRLISTGLTANNSTIEVNYTTSNNTSSVEFQMFAPPASNVDLHVYDENGNHVGYDKVIGNTTLGFPASYTGRDSNPEITIIPSATNKTYQVKAVLTKSNSNMPTYITVHALETPFRPAVLAVTPNEIIQPTASNQNVSFTVIIGEAGHQHPLENVTVAISNITNANITIPVITQSKHDFGTIPAGTRETVTYTLFVPAGTPFGNYTGLITINSSNAGMQILNVTIPVIAHPNATVLIYTNKSKIEIGENTTITATVLDENGTAIIGTPVEFTLSNNSIGLLNATSLTTDSNGTASVVFTGVAEGITNLTASEPAGNSSTLNITVIDTTPPVITLAIANPDTIIADGIDTTLLNVTAKDASGIASVSINLSAIGGSEKQLMQNNSGVWQYITNTTKVGNFQLQVNVTDNAGNFNNSVSIALNATAQKLSLSIYTDKNNYIVGDIMNVTVHLANSGEAIDVRAKIWIELPNGNSKTFIDKKVKLPTGLDVNITILSIELPPIPNGTYTWHFQLLNQSTGEIIAEDSTEWMFVDSTSTDYHYWSQIQLQLPSLERIAS